MKELFIYSLLIGIFSFVYTYILTDANQILNPIYKRLYKFFKTEERKEKGKGVHWIFMIIMYCEKCNAGQIALWLYLYNNYRSYILDPLPTFLFHVAFISLSIFFAAFIKLIYTKHE